MAEGVLHFPTISHPFELCLHFDALTMKLTGHCDLQTCPAGCAKLRETKLAPYPDRVLEISRQVKQSLQAALQLAQLEEDEEEEESSGCSLELAEGL